MEDELDQALILLDNNNKEVAKHQPLNYTNQITENNVKEFYVNTLLLPIAKELDDGFKVITHHISQKERLNLLHSYDISKMHTHITSLLIKKMLRSCKNEMDIYKIDEKYEEKLNDEVKKIIEYDETLHLNVDQLNELIASI